MAGGLRSLTLIGVTNSFSFDYCAIQPYLSNGVPGRELRIVERSGLQIHCGCLTAFYRKYGEFIALIVVLPCVVIAQLETCGLHTTVNSVLLQGVRSKISRVQSIFYDEFNSQGSYETSQP